MEGVHNIAQSAFEVVTAEQAVVFQVANDWFNGIVFQELQTLANIKGIRLTFLFNRLGEPYVRINSCHNTDKSLF